MFKRNPSLSKTIQDGIKSGKFSIVGTHKEKNSIVSLQKPEKPEKKSSLITKPSTWYSLSIESDLITFYEKQEATLLIPGKPLASVNEFKWKHWSHHHQLRNLAKEAIKNASWICPIGHTPPNHHQEQRQEIVLVKYGGRLWDNGNFVASCKEILDELVKINLLRDDSPKWVKDHYFQVKGPTIPRIEIIFLKEKPQKI
jgi:hypothetical protein